MSFIRWLVVSIGVAIVGVFVTEFWDLIKAGAFFDFIEAAAGKVRQAHFIRTDLVSPAKQSVAEWILAISCVAGWGLSFWSRIKGEGLDESMILGIGYGFAVGLGILFILSNFERFRDIHLAVGNAQYFVVGIVIISTVALAIAQRSHDRARQQ